MFSVDGLRGGLVLFVLLAALAMNAHGLPDRVALLPADGHNPHNSSDALLAPVPVDAPARAIDAMLNGMPDAPGVLIVHGPRSTWEPVFHAVSSRAGRRALAAIFCGDDAPANPRVTPQAGVARWRLIIDAASTRPLTTSLVDNGAVASCASDGS